MKIIRFSLIIVITGLSYICRGQNFITEGRDINKSNIKEILAKSFLIKENVEDTILVKIDDLSLNLISNLKRSDTLIKPIVFVSERQLYENLIDDYFDIRYLDVDYNIVRIGYMKYSDGKFVQLVFYRNQLGKWDLIHKDVNKIGKIRYSDFLFELIREKKRHK